MGKKAPDPNKYWQPSDEWLKDFETFRGALIAAIGGSYGAENAAKAVGCYKTDLSDFLTFKKRGSTSHRKASNIIAALRGDQPAGTGGFEPAQPEIDFWTRSDIVAVRASLANELARQLDVHRNAPLALPQFGYGSSPQADGPRLARMVQVNPSLGEAGNAGSPEAPQLFVQLSFGRGEDELSDDGAVEATLRLVDCTLAVRYEGGRMEEPMLGETVRFTLRYKSEEDKPGSLDIEFEADGTSAQHEWTTRHAPRGRALFGRSDEQLLCSFSERPSTLQVSLHARPNNFRLDRAGGPPSDRDHNDINRVLAALARRATLGVADSSGYYVLDRRAVLP
jgi:hypothetical protein